MSGRRWYLPISNIQMGLHLQRWPWVQKCSHWIWMYPFAKLGLLKLDDILLVQLLEMTFALLGRWSSSSLCNLIHLWPLVGFQYGPFPASIYSTTSLPPPWKTRSSTASFHTSRHHNVPLDAGIKRSIFCISKQVFMDRCQVSAGVIKVATSRGLWAI